MNHAGYYNIMCIYQRGYGWQHLRVTGWRNAGYYTGAKTCQVQLRTMPPSIAINTVSSWITVRCWKFLHKNNKANDLCLIGIVNAIRCLICA